MNNRKIGLYVKIDQHEREEYLPSTDGIAYVMEAEPPRYKQDAPERPFFPENFNSNKKVSK